MRLAAKPREKTFARVAIKTWKPETAHAKSLALRVG